MPSRQRLDRHTVVEVAADLYDASGGGEVTLKDVAVALGVKTPSLYNHIRGQDELRRDLALHGTKLLRNWISRAAIGKSGDDAVLATAKAYREFAHQHPGLYQLTQRAPAPDDDALQLVAEEILEVLYLVLLAYGMDEIDKVHAIRALRSLVHGFVSLELSNGFGMPVDIDDSFRAMLDMYIRGLRRVSSLPGA